MSPARKEGGENSFSTEYIVQYVHRLRGGEDGSDAGTEMDAFMQAKMVPFLSSPSIALESVSGSRPVVVEYPVLQY